MKRLLAMLWVCLLLLCGCQGAEEEPMLELPQQFPHDCYDLHSNDSIAARRVAVYGDQIYFGCNCGGEEQILTMSGDAPSRCSVLLEGGRILRLCGSVLLAERDEQLLGLALEEDSDWQVLMSYSPGKGFLPKGFQRGEEWLFLPDSARSELLCVNTKEMTAVLRPSVGCVVDMVQQGDRLYYTKAQDEGGYTLYTAYVDLRGIRALTETEHPNLSVSGERIACYGGTDYPAIYDLQSETYQPLKVGYSVSASAAGGGVLTVRYWESEADRANGGETKLYAVDIASGEELPAAEYRQIEISAEGEAAFFGEQKKWRFGAADEVDPLQASFEHFAVGDRYIACNEHGMLTVIHRQRNTAFYFEHH